MALAHPVVERLPITTAMVYLLIGIALGPWWKDVIRVDPILHAPWLHRAAEISVVVSLFTVGMKLRLPVLDRRLRPAVCLAFASMVITVALVAAAGVWLLQLPLGAAVLLGGILAPTDPVLASDVQTKNAEDRDKLRLTLTAEGGLNDGTAFPFVMLGLGLLGLHDLGGQGQRWWLIDVTWAVLGGLALGSLIGYTIGQIAVRLKARQQKPVALGEYIVLGVIGVTYGLAVLLHASGFLAVFAAGAALRAVERHATEHAQHATESLAASTETRLRLSQPPSAGERSAAYLAGTLLTINEQLERILEVALVLLVGAVLMVAGLSFDALWFAPLLFLVIRPLAALPLLFVARFTRFEFAAISWFGIRGIGSIYYLMFAIERGLPAPLADTFVSLTLTIVACSVIAHGVSVTPLLNYYSRVVGKK